MVLYSPRFLCRSRNGASAFHNISFWVTLFVRTKGRPDVSEQRVFREYELLEARAECGLCLVLVHGVALDVRPSGLFEVEDEPVDHDALEAGKGKMNYESDLIIIWVRRCHRSIWRRTC